MYSPPLLRLRLSDGTTFFDATLLGPYDVSQDKIVVSPFTGYHGNILSFKRFDLIRILDYFSKIDDTKICRLKMVIRKIGEAKMMDKKINRPEDLAFYAQIHNLVKTPQNIQSSDSQNRY